MGVRWRSALTKLMKERKYDNAMQTNIACSGCPYLTLVIHDEKGKPPSLSQSIQLADR